MLENVRYPFVNTPLPYAYNALEPYIDAKTMMLHHDRHLQTYIDNLNSALNNAPQLQNLSLVQLIRTAPRLPGPLSTVIRNNAGGVFNHRFFFKGLANPAPREPQGPLSMAIQQGFGSFAAWEAAFRQAALSVFGSGYAWLIFDGRQLRIVTTINQNSPVENGLRPILCLDVWEHAYYLKHYNVRADYIRDWLCVIDWEEAEKMYSSYKSSAK